MIRLQIFVPSNYNVLLRIVFTFFLNFTIVTHSVKAQNQDSLQLEMQVDSLIKVSAKFTDQKEFNDAIDAIKIANQYLENRGDSSSSLFGKVCNSHGRIYFFKGNYPKAEELYLKSNAILKQVDNKNRLAYLTNIGCLGSLYLNTGKLEKAERYLLEADHLGKITIGEKHPDYALNLSNLGRVYRLMGQFEKAEYFMNEALILREKYIGKESRSYAFSLNSLAILYKDRGNYLKAEKLYLEAIRIREKVLGKAHGDYIASLTNLAILYKSLGNYEKSESLFLEALSNCTQNNEREFLEYANILSNLGVLKYRMQKFEQAESLLLRTINILQGKFESDHPTFVLCKANLANIYRATGDFLKAEVLLLEILSMIDQSKGKNNYHYANALHNLGILYDEKGDQNTALLKCKESLEIRVRIFGRDHPYCADSYEALADIYFHMGEFRKAEVFFDSLVNLNILLYKRSILHLSEYELSQYINTFKKFQNKLYSLAFYAANIDNHIAITCLENSLFYKNILLRSNALVKNRLNIDTANYEKLLLKKSLEYRLSLEYLKPLVSRDSIQFNDLMEQSIGLEKNLIGSIVSSELKFDRINFKDIQKNLKFNEVAIEFIHFNQVYGSRMDSILYAAILVKPGMLKPEIIFLFDQRQLEALLENKMKCSTKQFLNLLYSGVNSQAFSQCTFDTIPSLFELIWKPIMNELIGVSKIYLSKTGLLHQINLTAISDQNGVLLNSKFNIVELSSTHILMDHQTRRKDNQKALLVGGIYFERDTMGMQDQENITDNAVQNNSHVLNLKNPIDQLGFDSEFIDSMFRGGNWNYLHWTDKEINSIDEIVRKVKIIPILLRGKYATEEKFKEISQEYMSPRIIHLATHGFFFPDRTISAAGRMSHDSAASEGTVKAATPKSKLEFETNEPVFKISDHPMIRSGLLMAGSNYAWKTGKPIREGMEDGILTAYEISHMDLSNTELVVLSACETGLGDIQGNEGVYGLQRAFKIAGAKYLVMSLWQVPDRETKEFMVSFYKNWLTKKKSIPDAFRMTQKEMRDRFINPYAWAGFVLVE